MLTVRHRELLLNQYSLLLLCQMSLLSARYLTCEFLCIRLAQQVIRFILRSIWSVRVREERLATELSPQHLREPRGRKRNYTVRLFVRPRRLNFEAGSSIPRLVPSINLTPFGSCHICRSCFGGYLH